MNTKQISDIFEWLNEITYHKTDINLIDEKSWDSFIPYLIHRFISMKPEYVELTDQIQSIPHEHKKQIYLAYKGILPKQKTYFKYIKGDKIDKDNKLLSKISVYYECSLKEANDYCNILTKEELKGILVQMGCDSKEIKNLLKKTK
jgi:hypothetical protein